MSVIIPTYSRSGYLRQAIASVLEQSFANFEVVVVDDGSTDETAAVVAAFGDERIVYNYQENAGRSQARNCGLAAARGIYVAFLDDDDLYLRDKLTLQAAYLDAHPDVGLVAGGAKMIAVDGAPIRDWRTWQDQPELALPQCLYACPLLTCSVLVRRDWLDRLEHWFDPAMDRAEDTELWIRLLLAGCRMAWTPDIVCSYRQHQGSSQGEGERYYQGYLKLLSKLFTQPDIPQVVEQERPSLYAHFHLLGASHAYAAGQIESGQSRLLQAATLCADILEGNPPEIVSQLSSMAHSVEEGDPEKLLHAIFTHLPLELAGLGAFRRHALSMLHMQRVFVAHAGSARIDLRDWLLGVANNPAWLVNRGVWSILVRNMVHQSTAQRGTQ